MTEVFNMGEYGMYIWPAWGFALLILGGLVIASVRVMRARERELDDVRHQVSEAEQQEEARVLARAAADEAMREAER